MANLPLGSSPRLDGQTYNLARNEDVRKVLGASGRRWNVVRKKIATKRIPRPDVRPGDIEGEWIITWDDWSKGMAGDHENLPGTYHYAENVECGLPGMLRGIGQTGVTVDNNTSWEAASVGTIEFNNQVYTWGGRFLWKIVSNTGISSVKDFGAGKAPTDIKVHNNLLVIAMGETEKVYTMNTSETFTQATDNVFALYYAVVKGRLWRAKGTSQVSNIGPTDSSLTLANWSTDIPVGDNAYVITQLNGYGDRLAVSKVEGLFMSEQTENLFVNVTPQITPQSDNGRITVVRGSDVLYPHSRSGLLRYNNGIVEEIGLDKIFHSTAMIDTDVPGLPVGGVLADREYIYVTLEPSYHPRANPTKVLKTTDNEATFTDLTANVTDGDESTGSAIGGLGTAAAGGYWYVGYSAVFYGVVLEFIPGQRNTNTATLTVQYWNGTAWTSFGTNNPMLDNTKNGNATLGVSGTLGWRIDPGNWATKIINGTTAYWLRLSVSATLSATVNLAEVRVVTSPLSVFALRGRPRRVDDIRRNSFIWDTVLYSNALGPFANGICVSRSSPLSRRSPTLVISGWQAFMWAWIAESMIEEALDHQAGKVYLCRHDGGMPETNKQFLGLTIKGKTIDSNHAVQLHYNLNEQTSTWTSVVTNLTTSPSTTALIGITGYAIQPRITINDHNHAIPTEINELECRFRELPTYKNEYTMVLELADGQIDAEGVSLPDASVQLSNLEGDQGQGTITLIDPLNRSKSVIVSGVQELEYIQDGVDYPRLLVEVKATEV